MVRLVSPQYSEHTKKCDGFRYYDTQFSDVLMCLFLTFTVITATTIIMGILHLLPAMDFGRPYAPYGH